MQDFNEILQKSGLSEKEVKVYLTLLELGPQKANFLSRRTNIERANIYYHLEGLREKGLVTLYSEEDSTTYFKAEPVRRILDFAQKEQQKLEKQSEELSFIVPELESLQKQSLAKYPKLRFYDNLASIGGLYEEIIDSKELSAVVNIDRVNEFFPKYGLEFTKLTAKKKMLVRELVVPSKSATAYKKSTKDKNHKIKLLSKQFKHKTDILIFDDNVAFISYGRMVAAFVIEDAMISQAQTEIFDELWKKTK